MYKYAYLCSFIIIKAVTVSWFMRMNIHACSKTESGWASQIYTHKRSLGELNYLPNRLPFAFSRLVRS